MSVIQTNVAANAAFRNTAVSSAALTKSISRLSSGFRINRAADDAAGAGIANVLRAEGKSLMVAQRNASQANAMLQIADGAVTTVSGMLDRLKELASQSNSANVGVQRDKLDAEFQAVLSEISRITATTKYQGSSLVDGTLGTYVDTASSTLDNVAGVNSISISGTAAGTYTLATAANVSVLSNAGSTLTQSVTEAAGAQTLDFSAFGIKVSTGAGYVAGAADGTIVVAGGTTSFMVSSSGSYAANDLISLSAINLTTGAAGLNLSGLDVTTAANAQTALSRIDTAVGVVNTAIGTIGAAQSRIDFATANVATTLQNVLAAESTIRDADMAMESTTFAKFQILQQAGTAMLAQANQSAQTVLSLLR